MAGALILADQPTGAGSGTAGEGRKDIWKDRVIDLSCPEPGNTTYAWYILDKPKDSTAALDTPIDSTASFTPDKIGTYRIRLIVDGGGAGNTQTRVYRCRYDSAGALLERGWALPAIGEVDGEANYGSNARSWAEPLEAMRDDILSLLGDTGPSATMVFQPGGTASGNLYDSWALLMADFALIEGTVEILIDDSVTSPAVIPAGTWDMEDRATLIGSVTAAKTELTVGDGSATFLQRPAAFRHLLIRNAAGGYIGSATVATRFEAEEVTFLAADGSGRLVMATDGSKIHLRGKSLISTGSGEVCIELGDVESASLDIYVEDFSSVATDTLKNYAGTTISAYLSNSSVSCSESQTDVAGNLTIVSPPAPGGAIFVYRPGGEPTGLVYDTWTTLMAAHAAVLGPKVIEIDSSEAGGAAIIPTGAHALGGDTIIRGKDATIVMADGASFYSATILEGALTVYSDSSGPVFTWPVVAGPAKLLFRDSVVVSGAPTEGTPTSPLITDHVHLTLRDNAHLDTTGAGVFVVQAAEASLVDMFDNAAIDDGSEGASAALGRTGSGTVEVSIYDQGVFFQHAAFPGISWTTYCVRQYVIPLVKGVEVNAASTPSSVGGAYVSYQQIPKHANMKCLFRAVLETTSGTAGYEAYADLYDVHGQLNAGTPTVVPNTQLDTGSSSSPSGAPTSNVLVPSAYELDITTAIIDGTWVSDGLVLEARLWLGTAGGGNAATCKSAELIFEWTELVPLVA